jgi:hypothetical protein
LQLDYVHVNGGSCCFTIVLGDDKAAKFVSLLGVGSIVVRNDEGTD